MDAKLTHGSELQTNPVMGVLDYVQLSDAQMWYMVRSNMEPSQQSGYLQT